MNLLVMFLSGIVFGIGHSLAPYIILKFKARKFEKAIKREQKKGEYIQ